MTKTKIKIDEAYRGIQHNSRADQIARLIRFYHVASDLHEILDLYDDEYAEEAKEDLGNVQDWAMEMIRRITS